MPLQQAKSINVAWWMNFVSDRLGNGRRLQYLAVAAQIPRFWLSADSYKVQSGGIALGFRVQTVAATRTQIVYQCRMAAT